MKNQSEFRKAMLSWYDVHARLLPWRYQVGERANPYYVWMSEVMLQQTTVGAVKSYFEKFINLWPTIEDLANATQDDVTREWAGLGYYSRARNLHKCARVVVSDFNGQFPSDIKTLKTLPGIGDYTAAAIASIAFDVPATVIDGNVDRIVARLNRIQTPFPEGKKQVKIDAKSLFEVGSQDRPSCFAQSMMDLGATICTPKSPKCGQCPVSDFCDGYHKGDADIYPIKAAKKKIPEKHAVAYIYIDNGKVGIERRPEKGMLGGMVGFPTSDWVDISEIIDLSMARADLKIRHVFTHFALTLYPVFLRKRNDQMILFEDIDNVGLPTLFQKLWNMVRSEI